ncbi:Lipase maturation factor 2 [Microtus ochrogaster]|uniref:Lipase maturation factor 2 n=1 Tax=Microtus ochrogaster TaxID=79684 RepID=A0A8J6L5E0_MICOH|nr:Lipase maturation factor 2 [Microtus ochrogaster]
MDGSLYVIKGEDSGKHGAQGLSESELSQANQPLSGMVGTYRPAHTSCLVCPPPASRAAQVCGASQLASSHGLFYRMTGLGEQPEVVLEGSYDGQHWTEIEFVYKPGNGKEPVICLVRNHVANYPFHEQPPTYLRAQRYKYWFPKPREQSQ